MEKEDLQQEIQYLEELNADKFEELSANNQLNLFTIIYNYRQYDIYYAGQLIIGPVHGKQSRFDLFDVMITRYMGMNTADPRFAYAIGGRIAGLKNVEALAFLNGNPMIITTRDF